MATRYGAGELYGFDLTKLSVEKIRSLSRSPHHTQPCPFKPANSGTFQKCSKKGGVCSLRQYESARGNTGQPIGPPVTTCPSRFLESNEVISWVGKTLLG